MLTRKGPLELLPILTQCPSMWVLLGHLQGEANLLHFAGFLWSELRTITLKKFRGDTADVTFVLCIEGGYLIGEQS